MRNRQLAALLTSAAMCSFMGTAVAGDSNDEAPNFAGVWARANESRFFPVPGDTEGKPLEQLPNPNPGIVAGDYNNPILQPWAREMVKHNAELEQKEEHVPTAHGSCWPSGVPEVLNLREPVEFLQEKDKIIVIYQRDHQMREIFLTGKHSPNVRPSWYGESIGHYEGDTLVVDTIGQAVKPLSVVDSFGTPHTDKIHVTERYRVVTDKRGKALEVIFRVEDPGAFTMPWKGMVTYRPTRAQFEEVVCAENNRTFDGSQFGEMPEAKTRDF
jgi:hypothetical protein